MTTFLAAQSLKAIRPDVTARIVDVWQSRWGHVAVTADGSEYNLATGHYDDRYSRPYVKLASRD